jgi:hypothetical protein
MELPPRELIPWPIKLPVYPAAAPPKLSKVFSFKPSVNPYPLTTFPVIVFPIVDSPWLKILPKLEATLELSPVDWLLNERAFNPPVFPDCLWTEFYGVTSPISYLG